MSATSIQSSTDIITVTVSFSRVGIHFSAGHHLDTLQTDDEKMGRHAGLLTASDRAFGLFLGDGLGKKILNLPGYEYTLFG